MSRRWVGAQVSEVSRSGGHAAPARRRGRSKHSESAAEHIVARVPVARATDGVAAVVAGLVGREVESFEAVFVVDAHGKLEGGIRLADLLRAQPGRLIGDLVDPGYPRVGTHHDQEHVATEALARHATSVAVVDDHGRLIGAVPALSLLEILRSEHVEDLHRLAGIQRESSRDRSALEAPPTRQARHRLPWLVVGLGGSMIAAAIMSRFERVLASDLAVAFFVPAIVYLADAIGTQTEAIVVRGLSLSRLSLGHLLANELRTGVIIGVILAGLTLPVVALAFGFRLAISVASAILVAGAVATTIGLLFPWLLHRLGSDPALGSGPVATIIQDVLSLLIYFVIATVVMR
jgi:magnesium transporter